MKADQGAPGGHMPVSLPPQSLPANIDPKSVRSKDQLFDMSGTLQAAAVTSSVDALLLQAQAPLAPDMVDAGCSTAPAPRPRHKARA